MRGVWEEVPGAEGEGAPQARSSHAVSVLGRTLYVFGGEHEPRVPIDNSLFAFDLDGRKWATVEAFGQVPAPRIGVTMCSLGGTLFVFGGRDAEHEELNEFYAFDTSASRWTLLTSREASPPARSYHTMVADEASGTVYVFGGCGATGRLNDLWAFHVAQGQWEELPLPPEGGCVPRGGAALVVVPGGICVFFGFCGHELRDVHRFDTSARTWAAVTPEKGNTLWPSARSVFGAVSLPPDRRFVLVFGGELDPSDLGHAGAGKFSDEVFLFDSDERVWSKLEVKGRGPGSRGWFPAAPVGNGMLVYGGMTESNDRLRDMFLLTVND